MQILLEQISVLAVVKRLLLVLAFFAGEACTPAVLRRQNTPNNRHYLPDGVIIKRRTNRQ